MDEKMLKRQVTRYSNDAERFRIKRDKCYAVFKAYGNNNDYLNSQRYYAAAKRANDICKKYEVHLHRLK